MVKPEILRNVLLGLAALALVAVLAFLYDKTQAVDMREQGEVLDALRLLKQLDSRWDTEVLRARLEPGSEPPAVARREEAARALQNLAAALQKTPSPSLAAGLPELRKAMLEKEALVRKFRTEDVAAKQKILDDLSSLSSGPRVDTLTVQFSRELEATLTDKERFRVYLIAYAGALLILIAWLGSRIRAANLSLEQRVRQRTSELSEALEQLKESEAQLIQSEKMSSLGQMVAGVAHEINTPLAYVKNSLGTVSDRLGDLSGAVDHCEKLLALLQAGQHADRDELSRQYGLASSAIAQLRASRATEELASMVKDGLYGTGQMAEIVGNLKDFSRLDRSKVTSFNLNEGLNSTLVLAKHLLKSVKVDKRLGDIPPVVCSPSQVNQVFLNLVTNAVQAMENGEGRLTLTTRSEDGGVALEVADNGKGITEEVLPKIFDPFFSTKEAGKGTGLGLAVSYKIVQQHGGRIDVESTPGVGSRFTVWFPFNPPAELAA